MSRSDRVLVAAGGGALVLALAAAGVLFLPAEGAPGDGEPAAMLLPTAEVAVTSTPTPAPTTPPGPIVVDVAGAVARPGLIELPGGARIGDAIAAAGGYAGDADLDAVAATLNLAQRLSDGEQIRVPRVGDAPVAAPAASDGGASGPAASGGGTDAGGDGGLVNLNTATPEQLEALPGIGPVTVQKIVAAREERPFTSLDDVLQRGIIHRGQLEDIRELATAG